MFFFNDKHALAVVGDDFMNEREEFVTVGRIASYLEIYSNDVSSLFHFKGLQHRR